MGRDENVAIFQPLIAQVKENGKLAGKMLVMVESTLEEYMNIDKLL